MKFEKIDENKIRIFLNKRDLIEQNVNLHSFMSNSIESQDLFMYALGKAEKELGFITKNCQVRIEALAINTGDFIITVKKSPTNKSMKYTLRLHIPTIVRKFKHTNNSSIMSFDLKSNNEKNYNQSNSSNKLTNDNCNPPKQILYKFTNFENLCDFCNLYLLALPTNNDIAQKIGLYFYNENYYLSFENINSDCIYLQRLINLLNEFAIPVKCSDLYLFKLEEYGKEIFNNNALEKCSQLFASRN